MDTKEYLEFAIETLAHVEFEVQVMRTVLTSMCECASAEPNVMVECDQEKQNLLATAGDTPVMSSNMQKRVIDQLAKHSTEISMIRANRSQRKSHFSEVFVKGIDTKHFTSKIVSSLINDSLTLNGNSDIANVSLCKDNTQQLIRKIDQIESDEGIIITTGANVDESSTKRNVQKTEAAKPIESVKKMAKVDVDDNDAGGSESKTEQNKPVTRAPRQRKRVSAENLPRAMRNRKRPTIKRSTPRRSSIEAPRRSSIRPKSTAVEATPDPKPFKCVVYGCSYAGAKKHYLARHMKSHVKDSLVDCDRCEKKFKAADSSELKQHLAEHK